MTNKLSERGILGAITDTFSPEAFKHAALYYE